MWEICHQILSLRNRSLTLRYRPTSSGLQCGGMLAESSREETGFLPLPNGAPKRASIASFRFSGEVGVSGPPRDQAVGDEGSELASRWGVLGATVAEGDERPLPGNPASESPRIS